MQDVPSLQERGLSVVERASEGVRARDRSGVGDRGGGRATAATGGSRRRRGGLPQRPGGRGGHRRGRPVDDVRHAGHPAGGVPADGHGGHPTGRRQPARRGRSGCLRDTAPLRSGGRPDRGGGADRRQGGRIGPAGPAGPAAGPDEPAAASGAGAARPIPQRLLRSRSSTSCDSCRRAGTPTRSPPSWRTRSAR